MRDLLHTRGPDPWSEMKTKGPLFLILGLLAVQPVSGQRDDVKKIAVMLARNETSMTVGRVRYDLVGTKDLDISDPETLLLRVARVAPNGWAVRVYNPGGQLLMTGVFTDKELSVAEGPFTFYFTNGQVESSGSFERGYKTGVWKRYNSEGVALPERVYGEHAPEKSTFSECWGTLSCKP